MTAGLAAGDDVEVHRDLMPELPLSGARTAAYRHAVGHDRTAPRPAIIFDCDGVLNQEPGGDGVLKPEDVVLLPGAGEAVKAARDAGFLAVMITNRAQVARGLVSFAELDRIFCRIKLLLGECGGVIDAIYFCPHHPEPHDRGKIAELSIRCECRKPGALLFRRAIAALPIDIARSAVIGDSLRDIGAARAVGIAAYGVRTGYGCGDVERFSGSAAPAPDRIFAHVGEAVDFCMSHLAPAPRS